MALPIWGIYMQSVFADKTLPYSEDETFPTGIQSLCTSDSTDTAELPLGIPEGDDLIIIEN